MLKKHRRPQHLKELHRPVTASYRVSARDKLPRMPRWPAFQQPWSQPGTQALSMTTRISSTQKRPLRWRPGTVGDRMHALCQIDHNPHQLTTNRTPLDLTIFGRQTPVGDSNGLALIQASRAKGVEHYLNGLSGEGSALPVAAPAVHDPSPHCLNRICMVLRLHAMGTRGQPIRPRCTSPKDPPLAHGLWVGSQKSCLLSPGMLRQASIPFLALERYPAR